MTDSNDPVVVVGGCRTPFLRSGGPFVDLMAYDLARMAIAGLLHRTGIDPATIDRVVMGTVIQDMSTSNIAREAALAAGIPKEVPAHTVTQACISSNQAIVSAAEAISCGAAELVVAGGAETCSDIPIRFRRSMRKKLLASQKIRGALGWLKFGASLRPRHFSPEIPSIAEFSTGLTMGQTCDRLSANLGVTRAEQDAWARTSHQRATAATAEGRLAEEIVPATVPPRFKAIEADDGPRVAPLEKLASLRPAFTKPDGTATAANSSFLTDGASAVLLCKRSKAKELGLEPWAAIKGYAFTGNDSLDELLLGPAYATPKALDDAGVTLADIDVVEIHEAFAGSLLAALRCLASADFARDKLGRSEAVGEVDPERLNADGGSLSLGHPFGATGARLVISTCRRLRTEDRQLGLLAACAAGGLGHAMVLERVS